MLDCVDMTVGVVSTDVSALEATTGSPSFLAAAMLARGAANYFGAATVTLDTASLVVSVSSHKKEKKNRR